MARSASIERNTLETQISVSIDLDGSGVARLDTGVPFLEHMLDQIARHGMIDLEIAAKGDLHIDAHHTVEDLGISLGQAFAAAVGDKKGIRRYGHAYVPLDEALSRVVVDFSGRPGLHMDVPFTNYTSLCHAQEVIDLIGAEIENVNRNFARVETIKKFRLIDQLLDPEDEELTPTMKLKRKVVNEKYIDLIESMYGG